jgi:hypothetical protein
MIAETIANLYSEGHSPRDIARKLKTNRAAVVTTIDRLGIQKRSHVEALQAKARLHGNIKIKQARCCLYCFHCSDRVPETFEARVNCLLHGTFTDYTKYCSRFERIKHD